MKTIDDLERKNLKEVGELLNEGDGFIYARYEALKDIGKITGAIHTNSEDTENLLQCIGYICKEIAGDEPLETFLDKIKSTMENLK